MKRLILMLAICFGCAPSEPARSVWYARAVEIVRKSKDDAEIRGRMAVLWCQINNPGGENAGMTEAERHAAVVDLSDGWRDATR